MNTERFQNRQRRRLRIGMIGVGYWEPSLLQSVVHHDLLDLVWIAEPFEEHIHYAHHLAPGVECGFNPEEVFFNDSIDAVVIATHASEHGRLILNALRAGKHVFVERPLCFDYETFELISAEAYRRNLVVMSGQRSLYSSAVSKLFELIHGGELGQIRFLSAQRLNLGSVREDLDVLWHYGMTDISVIQHLFGDPNPLAVRRNGMDYLQRGVADVVHLDLLYPNGVHAHLHASWLEPHTIRRMVIVGTEKMAVLNDGAHSSLVLYDRGIDRFLLEGGLQLFQRRCGEATVVEYGEDDPGALQLAHFFDCIVNGVECLTGLEHAGRVLKILLSACSAERNNFHHSLLEQGEYYPVGVPTKLRNTDPLEALCDSDPYCKAQISQPDSPSEHLNSGHPNPEQTSNLSPTSRTPLSPHQWSPHPFLPQATERGEREELEEERCVNEAAVDEAA